MSTCTIILPVLFTKGLALGIMDSVDEIYLTLMQDGWTYHPFSGYLDSDGVIWGRGTQDTKSVGMQYYEAVKNMIANNVRLLRDVYLTLMPGKRLTFL